MKNTHKLIGLNKPSWKAAGFNSIYATVEKGKEDWFHCAFEAKKFPPDKLNSLFEMFKNSEENLWHDRNHKVVIEYDLESPLIIKLILDGITEQDQPQSVRKEVLSRDEMNYSIGHKDGFEKGREFEKVHLNPETQSQDQPKSEVEDIYEGVYMDVVKLVEKDNIQCEFYSETIKKLKKQFTIKRK